MHVDVQMDYFHGARGIIAVVGDSEIRNAARVEVILIVQPFWRFGDAGFDLPAGVLVYDKNTSWVTFGGVIEEKMSSRGYRRNKVNY